MDRTLIVRPALSHDAPAIAAIYTHYVLTSTVSFEECAVDAAEMAQRMAAVRSAGLPWLAADVDGVLVGYAYATAWRARPAYRGSVETSVYVRAGLHARGTGTALYRALLEELRAAGYHVAIGGIAQPNAASVALHEKLGFDKVAHFSEVGWKGGRWVDVGYWQRILPDAH